MELPAIRIAPISVDAYHNRLIKQGFKVLGSGLFATAYARKIDNQVIKVGRVFTYVAFNPENSAEIIEGWRRDGYLNFLDMLEKNTTNPLFPKIESVDFYYFENKRFTHDRHRHEYFYVVRMERLESYADASWDLRDQVFNDIGFQSLGDFVSTVKSGKTSHKNKMVEDAMKLLQNLWTKRHSDLHIGNVMLRKVENNFQVVITDPAS